MINIDDIDTGVLERAVAHYGPAHQIMKTVEEMGELTQALMRYLELAARMKSDPEGVSGSEAMEIYDEIAEETADAMIMISQLGEIFDNADEVGEWIVRKIERLKGRMA